jgi:hypothetical protein
MPIEKPVNRPFVTKRNQNLTFMQTTISELTDVIDNIPYRMALAGGWIDQPFLSKINPHPPGSMVVVSLLPKVRFMDRSGMGTSTRIVATKLWGGRLPDKNPDALIKELYEAENKGKPEPSGSQDMAGLLYPGINRLDYDYAYEGGYFPVHVESNNDPKIARWLENVIYMLPVGQRPKDYNPLGEKNLDPGWIGLLGQSGRDCFDTILAQDIHALGESMNLCMACWEYILPHTVRHPTITIDLIELLRYYQHRYAGAMYSGCGGGYLYVASDEPVPGASRVNIRVRV